MARRADGSHSVALGYLLWLFGFMGAHRFYFGKPVTGTLWFFTLGFAFVGWAVDLFLIPAMDQAADRRYASGPLSFDVAWVLLVFLGIFGAHRFYLGKPWTGLLYLFTGGLLLAGYLHDLWTLNGQVDEGNRAAWDGRDART